MKTPIYELTTLVQNSDRITGVQKTRLEFTKETPEVEMMRSQVHLLLMASFSSMLLMVSGAPRKHTPTEFLPADPIKDKVSTSV